MSQASVYKRTIPSSSCLAFQTITHDFRSTWHAHPEFEIVYIESGLGCLQYGEQQKQYSQGDILVLGPWVPHEFLEKSSNHQSISLLFNYDFITPGFFDCELTQEIKAFLHKASAGIIFREKMSHAESDIIKLILAKTGLEQAINLLFLLKKLSIQKESDVLSDQPKDPFKHKKYAKLQDILYFINKNAHRKLLVEEVAENFYLSRSHFSRFFYEQTGKNFSQYLLSIRVERACHLLKHTEKSITQISQEVGFDSISSFNRGFLQQKSMSPRNYRKIQQSPS
ncbi:AraC family transcriptional regulator [Neisseria sp. Ec49-e6-T10]|uniref:AraC family transcriptional regulator n=1 Tax=Neisseria sp. Ec49-e6-T10 TaxID=3140744 RepID=UPI003EBFCC6C